MSFISEVWEAKRGPPPEVRAAPDAHEDSRGPGPLAHRLSGRLDRRGLGQVREAHLQSTAGFPLPQARLPSQVWGRPR